ncbi:MAG: NADP-dependent oxidoreductase [Geodermatophilaceae bacterium]
MPTAYGFTRYGGTDVQEVLDLGRPTPGAGELLIAVRAAGVNPVDWQIREGYLAEVMPLDLPVALGREVAGVVEEVGQDVDGFSVHDEVLGTVAPGSGGYAEYTLVTASAATKKPPQVSFTDAAALPVAAGTAYDAISQLELREGESLLINGIGGGVGVAAAQLARDLGVFVLGTGSKEKRELAEALGATLVPYGDGVADRVREIMPNGVDAILDLVGGDALRSVADLVTDRARLLTTADPDAAAEFGGGGVERDGSGTVLGEIVALVADGKLDPHVTDVVALHRAADALASVETGHARGKVVISVP